MHPAFGFTGRGPISPKSSSPEYIAVSHDSETAWVTLQENNAIAILDIEKGKFTRLVGLGFKDHFLREAAWTLAIRTWRSITDHSKTALTSKPGPCSGCINRMGIASYRVGNETYLVMANEGDTRADWAPFNEEVQVGASAYTLDPSAVFPNAADLKLPANIGRLVVTNATGNTDNDSEFEKIFVPGARSFSNRKADGTLVFDSGDEF